MIRNASTRLARLTERVNAVTAGRDRPPLVVVVHPADTEYPSGTAVRTGGCVDVYHDFTLGDPPLPPVGPHTLVITLSPDAAEIDTRHRPG